MLHAEIYINFISGICCNSLVHNSYRKKVEITLPQLVNSMLTFHVDNKWIISNLVRPA